MEKTNLFIKFYNNLFNIKTFPKYIKEGLGRAILYAFLLNIFFGVFQGVLLSIDFNKNIETTKEYLLKDEYGFKLENGILEIKTNPIKINDGNTLIYVDSTKQLSEKEELRSISVHSDMSMLILKDGIIVTTLSGEQSILYKDILNGTISNKDIIDSMGYVQKAVPVFIIVITIIFSFFDYLINSVIIAAFAMITNFMMGLRIKFSAMLSLSIYASTLPSLLILIISSVIKNVYFNQAILVGSLVYVILILRNIRKEILGIN